MFSRQTEGKRGEGHAKFFDCVRTGAGKEDLDQCTGTLQFGRG
jgi:hypothetical protein